MGAGSSRSRVAATFLIDHCVTTVALPLREIGYEVRHVQDEVGCAAQDVEWLALAVRQKWVPLSQDTGRGDGLFRPAVVETRAVVFTFSSANLGGTLLGARIALAHQRIVDLYLSKKGPRIYTIGARGECAQSFPDDRR